MSTLPKKLSYPIKQKKYWGVLAIIQARLTSTRFPRKVLARVVGKTILQHCLDNTRRAMWVDKVVIAAPHPITGYEVEVWDSLKEEDVLSRYYYCAKKHKAKWVVRITADCPFVHPDVIDTAVEFCLNLNLGYTCFAPVDGLDVEVFSFNLLQEAFKRAKDPYDREHVTPYMRRKTKLSIDTRGNLTKVRRWYGLQR